MQEISKIRFLKYKLLLIYGIKDYIEDIPVFNEFFEVQTPESIKMLKLVAIKVNLSSIKEFSGGLLKTLPIVTKVLGLYHFNIDQEWLIKILQYSNCDIIRLASCGINILWMK